MFCCSLVSQTEASKKAKAEKKKKKKKRPSRFILGYMKNQFLLQMLNFLKVYQHLNVNPNEPEKSIVKKNTLRGYLKSHILRNFCKECFYFHFFLNFFFLKYFFGTLSFTYMQKIEQ